MSDKLLAQKRDQAWAQKMQQRAEVAEAALEQRDARVAELKAALQEAADELDKLIEASKGDDCGDPWAECPLHDACKDWSTAGVVKRARAALSGQSSARHDAMEAVARVAELEAENNRLRMWLRHIQDYNPDPDQAPFDETAEQYLRGMLAWARRSATDALSGQSSARHEAERAVKDAAMREYYGIGPADNHAELWAACARLDSLEGSDG